MQGGDLTSQVCEAAGIGNRVVSCRQSCGPACLRCQHPACVCFIHAISCLEPFQLCGLRGIHDQDPVDQVVQPVFHQQRDDENLVRASRSLRPASEFGTHCRMEDVLKALSLRWVRKDKLPEATPIEVAGLIKHLGTEQIHDTPKGGLARFHQLTGNYVCIDDRNTQ